MVPNFVGVFLKALLDLCSQTIFELIALQFEPNNFRTNCFLVSCLSIHRVHLFTDACARCYARGVLQRNVTVKTNLVVYEREVTRNTISGKNEKSISKSK